MEKRGSNSNFWVGVAHICELAVSTGAWGGSMKNVPSFQIVSPVCDTKSLSQ